MILTQEERSIVVTEVNQLWKGSKKCSVCGNEKWNLQDKVFSFPQFGIADEKRRQHYPVVIFTCDTCGNSLMFNIITLGFAFGGKKEEEVEPIQ